MFDSPWRCRLGFYPICSFSHRWLTLLEAIITLSVVKLGLVGPPLSGLVGLAASNNSLSSSGIHGAPPSLEIMSFLLRGSIMNNNPLQSVGAFSPPPSSRNIGKPSYRNIVHSSSKNLMVQEALAISIPLVKDIVSKAVIYSSISLIF
jgi:hypothetical protein